MKQTLLALSLFAMPPLVNATMVNTTFTGNLSGMYYAKCTNLQNGSCNSWANTNLQTSSFFQSKSISVGDQLKGTLTYDTSAPITAIIDNQAVYLNATSKFSFSIGAVTLPSTLLPANSGSYSVVDNRHGKYDSFYLSQWFSSDDWFASTSLNLGDSSGKAFVDYLAPTQVDFSKFNGTSFNLAFLKKSNGDQLQVYGGLTSFNTAVAPVPEPETYALMGVGLLGLLAARRRKTTKQ